MAIYKLNEICSLKKGKGKFYKRHLNKDRDIIGYHYGNLYKHSIIGNWDTYVSNEFYREDNIVNVGELMLIDVSESFDEIGYIVYNNCEPGLIGNHIIHLYDFKNVNSKWLYYYLIKNQKLFRQYSYGDKVASLKIPDIENLKICNMPSEDIQNAIIDIIRPLEEMEMLYKTIDDKISCIEKSILSSSSVTEQKFTFIKGGLPNKQEGPTMFLNVAAANGNPNRYVLNNPNVFIGDVTLSLDGNCGLVNNTLEGFNGYLYKVVVDNVDPWQIYYSLKTKYSQNIIKLNEIGTTIKHAPGAKRELRLHTFEHSEYLKYLYMLRIQLHKNRKTIIDSKKNLVKLLIK